MEMDPEQCKVLAPLLTQEKQDCVHETFPMFCGKIPLGEAPISDSESISRKQAQLGGAASGAQDSHARARLESLAGKSTRTPARKRSSKRTAVRKDWQGT